MDSRGTWILLWRCPLFNTFFLIWSHQRHPIAFAHSSDNHGRSEQWPSHFERVQTNLKSCSGVNLPETSLGFACIKKVTNEKPSFCDPWSVAGLACVWTESRPAWSPSSSSCPDDSLTTDLLEEGLGPRETQYSPSPAPPQYRPYFVQSWDISSVKCHLFYIQYWSYQVTHNSFFFFYIFSFQARVCTSKPGKATGKTK